MNALSFRRINPIQAHTDASFANSLEFVWTMGSNQVMVWDDSYLSVKFAMRYGNAGVAAALPATTGLSNAPLHCLFSDGSLRMNNKEISRLSDYSQSAYIHQLLTSSAQKQDNNNSANPLTLDRRWAVAGGLTEGAAISRRKQSLGIEDVIGTQTFTVSAKLPIWLTKEESGQNQSYLLRLVVHPNWRFRLTTSDATTPLTGAVPINAVFGANREIQIDVKEMTLNIRQYESVSVPRSITKTYMYSEFFSTTRAIDAAGTVQRFNFTMPKTVSSIFFTMFDAREAQAGVFSPTRFICDGSKNLVSYELRYAGTTLPSLKYALNLLDAPQVDRAENNDAFVQFIRDTMDLSPNGSQYSGVEWGSQPLFYHSVVKPPGSEAPQCDLELTFSAASANTILYLGALVPQAVDCMYNDTGIITSVDVYQTSE